MQPSLLILAQLDRDRTALDSAERAFKNSYNLCPDDLIQRNLHRIGLIRQKLF